MKNPQRLRSSTDKWPLGRPSQWGRINGLAQQAFSVVQPVKLTASDGGQQLIWPAPTLVKSYRKR